MSKDLENAINKLKDKEPREIANYLLVRKFRGSSSRFTCPLARFFQKETGKVIAVSPTQIARYDCQYDPAIEAHATPENIKNFILSFDMGLHPELVEENNES